MAKTKKTIDLGTSSPIGIKYLEEIIIRLFRGLECASVDRQTLIIRDLKH